ncbi:hypothetical protein KDH83_29285 [Achromobacter sp. Marseille-Q0513]|uniref:DUF6157 family protein n=1 Tax=Achromobacter sp. Marseille-Q0513 TaxID=2829161 RepID=UPI001B969087|nr:hypothetical protein [Achromobacter sp. Marseille-Q0513]
MGTTNYVDTFILASADSKARAGVAPARPGTVAALQYGLLRDAPYRYTSDELLFEVHASRQGIDQAGRKAAWDAFFARSQACLRASPLVKQFGWGLHHDGQGKVALVGVETDAYRRLAADQALKVVPGMRSSRAG